MEGMKNKQPSLMDGIMSFGGRTKVSRVVTTLDSISELVDWKRWWRLLAYWIKVGQEKVDDRR